MTEISELLIRKRGVSSRHLQHYMNFIRYRKIIKYTIEYLEINEKMYNDLILLVPKLKSDDVLLLNYLLIQINIKSGLQSIIKYNTATL